jgi:hypothetical protein
VADGRSNEAERPLDRGRRQTYLEVLGETGNSRAAAEAIGMDRSTLRHRRRRDPEFDQACEEAVAAADARLAAGEIATDPFEAVRRGSNGRLQIVAVGAGRWTGLSEQKFFASLRVTGNMSASARAAGFTPETVWERRRQWPAFAATIEAVLEEAEVELEFRLAKLGNDVAPSTAGTAEAPPAPPFDPEFALKFLKWREEKRRGGGRRGRGDRYRRKEQPIEEVRASIMRKLDAIEAHEKRKGGAGDANPG